MKDLCMKVWQDLEKLVSILQDPGASPVREAVTTVGGITESWERELQGKCPLTGAVASNRGTPPPGTTLHDGSWVNELPSLRLLPPANLLLVPPIG